MSSPEVVVPVVVVVSPPVVVVVPVEVVVVGSVTVLVTAGWVTVVVSSESPHPSKAVAAISIETSNAIDVRLMALTVRC
jgi:hypothetical protein